MRKIPTLFKRDPATNLRYVTSEVNPGCDWVLAGEGVATRKFDGTCCMLDTDGRWWARREVKPGKSWPDGWIQVGEPDPETGKSVGWEPVEQSSHYKAFLDADLPDVPGTYELCGPKVNGNPEQMRGHVLVPHGGFDLFAHAGPRTYDTLSEYLAGSPFEGIVWHHPDGRMAKLKKRDFPAEVGRV
jgi:hypothetical protein